MGILERLAALISLVVLLISFYAKVYSFLHPIGISDWNFHKRKEIRIKGNKFCFAVFGDNKNSHYVFEKLIDSVNRDREISFAFDLGDLVYDGEKEKYKYFLNQVKRFKVPLLTAVGNHDIKEKGRAVYYSIFGPFYYAFSIKNVFFIVLDDANEVRLEDSQIYWLREQLKRAKKFKYRIVLFHVPLFDPRTKKESSSLISIPIFHEREFHHSLKDKRQARYLLNLFKKYGVTHIYASHIHAYYTGVWSRIPYTITGGAGAELVGNNPNHDFYHYLKICVTPNSYTERVVKLPTPSFEVFDRIFHDFWIYIYAFFAIHFYDVLLTISFLYLVFYVYKRKRYGF